MIVCVVPSSYDEVFQSNEYGSELSLTPDDTPSIQSSTFSISLSSVAMQVMEIISDTIDSFGGDVIVTMGGVVSTSSQFVSINGNMRINVKMMVLVISILSPLKNLVYNNS